MYVKASFFDNEKDGDQKYSSFFPLKEETLLSGKILTTYKHSARIKFDIDDAISAVNYNDIVIDVDEKDYLIWKNVEDSESVNNEADSNIVRKYELKSDGNKEKMELEFNGYEEKSSNIH